LKFINHIDELSNYKANEHEEGREYQDEGNRFNPVTRGFVALENIFYTQDRRKSSVEQMKPSEYIEINIGTETEPRIIKVGKGTYEKEMNNLVNLLKEYRDVFAFTYDELKAYREDVFQHTIPLKPECQKGRPFRQKLRQINPKLAPIVKKELEKMLAAGIIAPTRHSTWCSNLVVVREKNGSLRICIDFRNLNIACQKDNYPLPNMETLLQQVTGSSMMSMLDGFSGYNQVVIQEEDRLNPLSQLLGALLNI